MRDLTSTIELSNGSFLMNEDDNLIELDGLLQYMYPTKKVLDYNGLIHLAQYVHENYIDNDTMTAIINAIQNTFDSLAITGFEAYDFINANIQPEWQSETSYTVNKIVKRTPNQWLNTQWQLKSEITYPEEEISIDCADWHEPNMIQDENGNYYRGFKIDSSGIHFKIILSDGWTWSSGDIPNIITFLQVPGSNANKVQDYYTKLTDTSPILYKCITANSDTEFTSENWQLMTQFPKEGQENTIYIEKEPRRIYYWDTNKYINLISIDPVFDNSLTIGTRAYSPGSNNYNVAIGYNTTSVNYCSIAIGYQAQATGYNSIAIGQDAQAVNYYAIAAGYQSLASGSYSRALGPWSMASAYCAWAEGHQTNATGSYSHAEGYGRGHTGDYQNFSINGISYWTGATGYAAHSEGFETFAAGDYSHTEGYNTVALKGYSHAEGYCSVNNGSYSHVEGYYTRTDANYSHVEGYYMAIDSSSYYSHAEGYGASYTYSYWGYLTYDSTQSANGRTTSSKYAESKPGIWSSSYSHLEGYYNALNGSSYSHIEGEYNFCGGASCSHTEGYQNIQGGSYCTHVEGLNNYAAGGNSNHIEGKYNMASGGNGLHAEGLYNMINAGYGSHVEGECCSVFGSTGEHGEGYYTYVSGGNGCHAEGIGNRQSSLTYEYAGNGYDRLANNFGRTTLSSSTILPGAMGAGGNHSEGQYTCATGSYGSHSEGIYTFASGGGGEHAEGQHTFCVGSGGNHTEGVYTMAAGAGGAHAEGRYTFASGGGGEHSEGIYTYATGSGGGHAEGYLTYAGGTYGAHAEGYKTYAAGANGAHAEGVGTVIRGNGAHVGGTYNIIDEYVTIPEWTPNTLYEPGDKVKRTSIPSGTDLPNINFYICKTENTDSSFVSSHWTQTYLKNSSLCAEIIGNGYEDTVEGVTTITRSNARVLDWDGNEYLAGDLYLNYNFITLTGKKVATEEYTNNAISTLQSEINTTILALRRRIAALESEVASLKNSSNNATDSQLESETGSIITDENGNPIEFDLSASITPSTVVMEDGQPLYTESGNTLEYNQQGG